MDLRAFKDANITRHDSLMPGFAKTNMSTRPVGRKLVMHLVILRKERTSDTAEKRK